MTSAHRTPEPPWRDQVTWTRAVGLPPLHLKGAQGHLACGIILTAQIPTPHPFWGVWQSSPWGGARRELSRSAWAPAPPQGPVW